jgi:hypothetical protein
MAKRKTAKQAVTVATTPKRGVPRPCECGCGGMTEGGRFRPGHDAKLASRLLAEARAKATEEGK